MLKAATVALVRSRIRCPNALKPLRELLVIDGITVSANLCQFAFELGEPADTRTGKAPQRVVAHKCAKLHGRELGQKNLTFAPPVDPRSEFFMAV